MTQMLIGVGPRQPGSVVAWRREILTSDPQLRVRLNVGGRNVITPTPPREPLASNCLRSNSQRRWQYLYGHNQYHATGTASTAPSHAELGSTQEDMAKFPIVDSHIHLYAANHITSLNWTAGLPSDHALNRQNSVSQYRSAVGNGNDLAGFVFLETDRKSGLQDSDWHDSLEEVEFLARIAKGTPRPDEGHQPEDGKLVLGIVPWAPVPAGPSALAKYVGLIEQRLSSESLNLIKGFRYLVQDKPAFTMLQPDFLASLQWIGTKGYVFDLGVDARSGGMSQLEEACDMMHRVYSEGSELRIIINHLCKPNLRLSAPDALRGHPEFTQWKSCIDRMAGHKSAYMKLSGLFSELPPQSDGKPAAVEDLVVHTKPWIDAVFAAFGPSRIMFGSDWPVCNVGGPGINKSWQHWKSLIEAILDDQKLSDEDKQSVWAGTAVKAYNIIIH